MEEKKTSISFTKWKPIEIMLAVLFLMAPFYFHPNIGGEGLRVPNNITVWMMAAIIIWYSLYQVLKRPTFVIPKYFGYIVAFPILITLSGFVTGVEQPLKWLFRLLFIWGGLAFFFSLFQHGLKQGRLDRILFIIVVSALLQGLFGLAQIWLQADMPFWLPKSANGVPSGLFQQINNQATYQVTAIMIAVYLASRPLLAKGAVWMQRIMILTVASSAFLVTLSGSRIGLLGLLLGLMIAIPALWHRLKLNKSLSILLLMALIMGVMLGLNTSKGTVVDKTIAMQSGYSGSARLGIYSISVDLIKQQPVFGHGVGSFPRVWQYAKPDFYQTHPEGVLPNKFVSHPHNETLFWLVEGGLIAGVGLFAILLAVILALKKIGWQRGGAYAAILLPLGLHTQVELPFYTSVVHWILFILLLFILFHNLSIRKPLTMTVMAIKTLGYVGVTIVVSLLLFFSHTIRAHFDFYDFYHSPLSEQVSFKHAYLNPYLREEAQWINMSSILYSSMEFGLQDNVLAYIEWGENLLIEKPDVDLYKKLAEGYNYLGDNESFCKTAEAGLLLYPMNMKLEQAAAGCRK
jgi:O-antigen ligase